MDLKNFAKDAKKIISAIQATPSVPPFMEGMMGYEKNRMSNFNNLIDMAQQVAKGKTKRRAVLTYNKRTFRFKGKEYALKGNTDFALLCDIFYTHCPKSDKKLHWEDVYKRMPSNYQTDPYSGREKIRGTIRSLNRWAKQSLGIPTILKLERDYIQRHK